MGGGGGAKKTGGVQEAGGRGGGGNEKGEKGKGTPGDVSTLNCRLAEAACEDWSEIARKNRCG